ncbi:MAG TPA: hypothetical protein VNA13_02205 [Xanthomonadales bacterium]|nr:hypothetical protein [Xanthomonadales bacterium]
MNGETGEGLQPPAQVQEAPEVATEAPEVPRRESNPLGEALGGLLRKRDEDFTRDVGATIDDAVNSLRFDEYGKETHLTQEQVRDVHEAFFKASATRLSPEDRRRVLKDAFKDEDWLAGIETFPPEVKPFPPKTIVRQGA